MEILMRENLDQIFSPQDRYVARASMMGITRNKKWLEQFRNKLCYMKNKTDYYEFRSEDDVVIYYFQLFEMMDLMQLKYQDNWDIKVTYHREYRKYCFSFIIMYNRITISNTSGHSRNIRDLYIFLPLAWNNVNKCIYTTIFGGRASLYQDEWISGYLHSHLAKLGVITTLSNIFSISEFCIGTEDLSELVILQKASYSIENFELLLFTIDSMVAWESEEGVPFYRMHQVTDTVSETRIFLQNHHIEQYFEYMFLSARVKYLDLNKINYVVVDNRFTIKQDASFSEMLLEGLRGNRFSDATHLLCKRGADGHFYSTDGDSRQAKNNFLEMLKESPSSIPYFYIQGKKYTFRVFGAKPTSEDISETIIYPKFLSYATEQLEAILYKNCIRGNAIVTHYSSGYVSGNSEQNQVSL